MNSTLGSVVPLAMFIYVKSPGSIGTESPPPEQGLRETSPPESRESRWNSRMHFFRRIYDFLMLSDPGLIIADF